MSDNSRDMLETVLQAIQELRKETREDMSEHRKEDTASFAEIKTGLQTLRDAHNKAIGFWLAMMAFQGVIVTVLAVIQIWHLIYLKG